MNVVKLTDELSTWAFDRLGESRNKMIGSYFEDDDDGKFVESFHEEMGKQWCYLHLLQWAQGVITEFHQHQLDPNDVSLTVAELKTLIDQLEGYVKDNPVTDGKMGERELYDRGRTAAIVSQLEKIRALIEEDLASEAPTKPNKITAREGNVITLDFKMKSV